MPKIVGEVSLTVDGQRVIAQVCEGNYLILPGQNLDEKGPSLSEEDYRRVLDNFPQYEAEMKRRNDTSRAEGQGGVDFTLPKASKNEIAGDEEKPISASDESLCKTVSQEGQEEKRAVPKKGDIPPKRDGVTNKKRLQAIVAVIVALVLLCGLGVFVMRSGVLSSLIPAAQSPSTYMVTVLTNTLEPGQTIRESDLAAKEISAVEYEQIQTATYVLTDPATGQTSTITPTPVLYEDRQMVIGLFLARHYPPGSIITDRMITNQQVVADQYYADVEMADGTTSQIPIQASTTKGMTEVEIVAIVRNEAGEEIQIPLSTLVLEEKTLLDILDGRGGSILDQVSGDNDGGNGYD